MRPSRRRLLLGLAAVAVGLPATRLAQGGNSAQAAGSFLYDPRFADARRFAHRASANLVTHALLHESVPQQAQRIFPHSQSVAGLTSYADFTVLTDIARQSGHRLAFHGYHDRQSNTHVSWRVVTGGTGGETVPSVSLEREIWARQLATVLLGHEPSAPHFDGSWQFGAQGDRRTIHSWLFSRAI
jgi:hypothetical protein